MIFSIKIGLVIVLNLMGQVLSSQQAWTLNQCINYSLENNISLQNYDINRQLQQISLSQARLNQLPGVNAEVGVTESFGRTLDPATNSYSNINNYNNTYSIGSSVMLFSGFMQRNKIAFEKYNLRVASNKLEQFKNTVTYSVIDAYYDLLFNKGLYDLYTDNFKIMQEQCFALSKFIKNGRKAESDIYEFEATLATDSFLLIQQFGEYEKSILTLKSVMNFPLADTLIVDTMLVSINLLSDTLSASDILNAAKQNLPNIKVTENQILAAKKIVAQVRGNFSPSLSAYGGWNTQYYKTSDTSKVTIPFRQQFKNNAGEYVGLSLNIPIFSRMNKINSLRMANLEYKKAENLHKENLFYFEKEIHEVYIDWQTSKNEYFAAQKQLEKSKVAFITAEKKIALGQLNTIDYNIQKNELLKAKTAVLRTNLQLALKEMYVRFLLRGEWGNG
jgi:outer membrane protein